MKAIGSRARRSFRSAGGTLRKGAVLAAVAGIALGPVAASAQAVDVSKWSPEYIRSIAGTATFVSGSTVGRYVSGTAADNAVMVVSLNALTAV